MSKSFDRCVTLVLSDLHFGSDVDPETTGGLAYGKHEETAALKYVVEQAVDYKQKHRARTGLNLVIDGDLIAGTIHDRAYCAPLSDQLARARKNLQYAVDTLSANYPAVCVTGLAGNHDRRSDVHPQSPASRGRFDNHANDIYASLTTPKNCRIDIPKTPYARLEVFGHRFLATHGDGMIRIANPGRILNIAKIEAQVNRWAMARWRPDIVILGHHHTPSVTALARGCVLVVNGTTLPGDEFGLSIDYPETPTAQVLWESTPEHALGDLRIINIPRSVYGGK